MHWRPLVVKTFYEPIYLWAFAHHHRIFCDLNVLTFFQDEHHDVLFDCLTLNSTYVIVYNLLISNITNICCLGCSSHSFVWMSRRSLEEEVSFENKVLTNLNASTMSRYFLSELVSFDDRIFSSYVSTLRQCFQARRSWWPGAPYPFLLDKLTLNRLVRGHHSGLEGHPVHGQPSGLEGRTVQGHLWSWRPPHPWSHLLSWRPLFPTGSWPLFLLIFPLLLSQNWLA